MFKKFLAFSLLCLTAVSSTSFALTLDDVKGALSQASAISSQFEMTKRSASVNVPLLSSGRVLLVKDIGILWTTLVPFEDAVGFSQGKRGWLDASGNWQTTENRSVSQASEIMDQVMRGDYGFLENRFFLEVTGTTQDWRILATPKAGNAKEWITEVLITGDRHVKRVQMTMTDSTTTEILFKNAKDNPEIDSIDRQRLETLK